MCVEIIFQEMKKDNTLFIKMKGLKETDKFLGKETLIHSLERKP